MAMLADSLLAYIIFKPLLSYAYRKLGSYIYHLIILESAGVPRVQSWKSGMEKSW